MKHPVPYIEALSAELQTVQKEHPDHAELHAALTMFSVVNVLQQHFTEAQLQQIMQKVNSMLEVGKIQVHSMLAFSDHIVYPGPIPADRTMVVETLGRLAGYYIDTRNLKNALCSTITAYKFDPAAKPADVEDGGNFRGMTRVTRMQLTFEYEGRLYKADSINCQPGTFRVQSIQDL